MTNIKRKTNLSKFQSLSLLFVVAAMLLCLPAVASAQTETSDQPASEETAVTETAEESTLAALGLYLRMGVGAGYVHLSSDFLDHTATLSGAAIIPELVLGFSPVEDLELTAGLSGAAAIVPELGLDDSTGGADISKNQMFQLNIGPGISYYLPYQFYLGAGAAISYMVITLNKTGINEYAETVGDPFPLDENPEQTLGAALEENVGVINGHFLGFAVNAHVGKDWTVSETTGIGLSLQYGFAVYPKFLSGKVENQTGQDTLLWMGHSVGLMVTATMN